MTRFNRGWLIAGLTFVIVTALGWSLAPGGAISILGTVLLSMWAAITVPVVSWQLWRRLTYRVGVRLFLSYLLLGVTPFLFCFAFGIGTLVILIGQYTSVRVGGDMKHEIERLRSPAAAAVGVIQSGGTSAGDAHLRRSLAAGSWSWLQMEWVIRSGQEVLVSDGLAQLDGVDWHTIEDGRVVFDGSLWGVVTTAQDDGGAVVLVRIDSDAARRMCQGRFYQLTVVGDRADYVDEGNDVTVSAENDLGGSGLGIDFEGRPAESLFGEWPYPIADWLDRPVIWWFRDPVDLLDLDHGSIADESEIALLMRTSPRAAWDDFVLSRPELGAGLQTAMIAVAVLFTLIYAVAFLIAGSMIVSVTRSTARLTRGARLVAAGNLDHRIPVRRLDQLGDLASSFNGMAASVQSMLAEVREKERLARELELAREIQRSLLPSSEQVYGASTLYAAFRPATEVGGDYFDVFPHGHDRLMVAIGDVAGHGLSTGLLMASLKATLATLVGEGYHGAELVRRVHHVLQSQRPRRTTATLAVVEVDLSKGTVEVANAGHPPALLAAPTGGLLEVGIGSIPLGSPMIGPSSETAAFPPGSRLLMYSDGIPEAPDAGGDPFGYDRLAEAFSRTSALPAELVVGAILAELETHTGTGQPKDDITVLLLDHPDITA